MISKKFLTSSFVYTVVSALPLASSVILLPFYTWYLKTDIFGELSIYISFTLLVQLIANFSMDGAIPVFYYNYNNDKERLKTYIGSIVSAMLITGTITILLSLLFGNLLFNAIFKGSSISFYPFGIMSVVTAFFNSFFKSYSNLLVCQQKPLKFFYVNFTNFILTIVISLAGLYFFKHTLKGPIYGRLFSGVGIFLLAFFLYTKEFGIHFNTDYIKRTLKYCYPLLMYFIISWALNYLDRYIINYFMNPGDVGIYALTLQSTQVIDFVMVGLTSAIMPKLFSIWGDDKLENNSAEVNRYFHSFSAITIILIASVILFLPILIPLVIYKHSYYQSLQYIPLASLAFVLRAINLVYFLPIYFFKKTKSLPWVFFFSALIQIPLTIILVKQFGLWGALWSAFLTKPIQIFFMYLVTRKLIKYSYNVTKMILLPVLYSIMVIIGEYYFKMVAPVLVHLIEMVLSTIIIFLIFRKELISSFQKIIVKDLLKGKGF